ncbi:UNVERIFIED_CONTAM: hypothetical protein K2H54_045009 [Gekko kuhli]
MEGLTDEVLDELAHTEWLATLQVLVVLCQYINHHLETQRQSWEELLQKMESSHCSTPVPSPMPPALKGQGITWLSQHNSTIDWAQRTIQFLTTKPDLPGIRLSGVGPFQNTSNSNPAAHGCRTKLYHIGVGTVGMRDLEPPSGRAPTPGGSAH